MAEPEVRVHASADSFDRWAATAVVTTLGEAIAARDEAVLVLAGGSTPDSLYERLARDCRESLDWSRVHLLWGDERCVPPDHPESNYGKAMTSLAGLGVDPSRIARIDGESQPVRSALAYERHVMARLARGALDLVLLGLGDDGHTASLFPPAVGHLLETRYVVTSRAPSGVRRRISLTLPAINSARRVLFLVRGVGKAEVVARVLAGAPELPASHVAPGDGRVSWCLDADAASSLESHLRQG